MNTVKLPTVLFYVQHLVGVGHVFRATRIAQALAQRGCKVHLIWGGLPVPTMDLSDLEVHFLNPVYVANRNFKNLLNKDGVSFTDTDKEARKNKLLSIYQEVKPDIVVTEAFPFGRKSMRFELLPLMDAISTSLPKPITVASIRDIMQENRNEKNVSDSIDNIERYYDLVMVHGDPNLVRIEETLQGTETFMEKIRYTGLVSPEPIEIPKEKTNNVIVSAGSGAIGKDLITAALAAMPLSKRYPNNWTLSVGLSPTENEFQQIKNSAPKGMSVIRFFKDLTKELSKTHVSVSLAGYNTVGDILRAGCRSVLVPFYAHDESEQARRALMMEKLGVAKAILSKDLTPENLARAIDEIEDTKGSLNVDFEGAENAATMLIEEYHRN